MTSDVTLYTPSEFTAVNARPPFLFLAEPKASERFWEFFAANIRNKNTRRAYYKAACRFADWCEGRGICDLTAIKPITVAAFIEELQVTHSKPTVKQKKAGKRERKCGPKLSPLSNGARLVSVRFRPSCAEGMQLLVAPLF